MHRPGLVLALRKPILRPTLIGLRHPSPPSSVLASLRFASGGSGLPPKSPNLWLNAALAAGLIGAAGAAYYYETSGIPTSTSTSPSVIGGSNTFDITIGGGRNRRTFNFTRLSEAEEESKLRGNEDSETIDRPGNPVVRWDRNWLGSNEPCEDRSDIKLTPRSRSARDMSWLEWLSATKPTGDMYKGTRTDNLAGAAVDQNAQIGGSNSSTGNAVGGKDLMAFTVLDGHAGFATSEILSKVLNTAVVLQLTGLQAGYVPGQKGWTDSLRKLNPATWLGGSVWTPQNVMRAISTAYTELDDNFVRLPLARLPTLSNPDLVDAPTSPGSPTHREVFLKAAEIADNGSCALTAVVDAEEGDLYVAIAGDCRAVAGWEKDGVWRCDVLTEDQMGDNLREVQRMQKEHPGEEDTVIVRGRVHGGLQPTRAFGDAMYKWTQEQTNE